jgi:hypothetical protein
MSAKGRVEVLIGPSSMDGGMYRVVSPDGETARSEECTSNGYRRTREVREQQTFLVTTAQDAARLVHVCYEGGATAYLEVLTNETNAYAAELGLVQARLNEMIALVQMYRSLGGGWEP